MQENSLTGGRKDEHHEIQILQPFNLLHVNKMADVASHEAPGETHYSFDTFSHFLSLRVVSASEGDVDAI